MKRTPFLSTLVAAVCFFAGCAGDLTAPSEPMDAPAPAVASSKTTSQENPGIAPITSTPHGKTYGEWAADWWKWALETPRLINPVADKTGKHCDANQSGDHVWFLAGSFSQNPVTRTCTVPEGYALFFPLINVVWLAGLDDPPERRTEEFMRSQLTCIEDASFGLVEIDGVAVNDPEQYLERSVLFDVFLPEDNVFRIKEKWLRELTFSPSVDEGYYLFVNPLTPGDHTMRWQASTDCFGGFSQDITYHLTVE